MKSGEKPTINAPRSIEFLKHGAARAIDVKPIGAAHHPEHRCAGRVRHDRIIVIGADHVRLVAGTPKVTHCGVDLTFAHKASIRTGRTVFSAGDKQRLAVDSGALTP